MRKHRDEVDWYHGWPTHSIDATARCWDYQVITVIICLVDEWNIRSWDTETLLYHVCPVVRSSTNRFSAFLARFAVPFSFSFFFSLHGSFGSRAFPGARRVFRVALLISIYRYRIYNVYDRILERGSFLSWGTSHAYGILQKWNTRIANEWSDTRRIECMPVVMAMPQLALLLH